MEKNIFAFDITEILIFLKNILDKKGCFYNCSGGPCWGHLESQNKKCDYSETFRKWSPACVQSFGAVEREQKSFLQLRQPPRTSKKPSILHAFYCFEQCWAHLESQNKKSDFSETFTKWSPACRELFRAHEREQNYSYQHM